MSERAAEHEYVHAPFLAVSYVLEIRNTERFAARYVAAKNIISARMILAHITPLTYNRLAFLTTPTQSATMYRIRAVVRAAAGGVRRFTR